MFRQLSSKIQLGFFIITVALLSVACKNSDKPANDFDAENIFFDYTITGQEGDDNLTILLQYKEGDEEGTAVAIEEPGKILLDGEAVPGDSTKRTGPFYEVNKPIASFAGKHIITFINPANTAYNEEFEFQPLSLVTIIPDSLQRDSLVIEFEGLESEEYIRVVITDTVFENEGINRVDTVINGRLIISKTDLQNLVNGPVQLELIREYERPIKNGTEQGGRLRISYGLKRELILRD
jgi:hypothetical protein